jgi:hypothetical protein
VCGEKLAQMHATLVRLAVHEWEHALIPWQVEELGKARRVCLEEWNQMHGRGAQSGAIGGPARRPWGGCMEWEESAAVDLVRDQVRDQCTRQSWWALIESIHACKETLAHKDKWSAGAKGPVRKHDENHQSLMSGITHSHETCHIVAARTHGQKLATRPTHAAVQAFVAAYAADSACTYYIWLRT